MQRTPWQAGTTTDPAMVRIDPPPPAEDSDDAASGGEETDALVAAAGTGGPVFEDLSKGGSGALRTAAPIMAPSQAAHV